VEILVFILRMLNNLLLIYMFIMLARALMSWFRPDPYNPIVQFLYAATEPVLRPFRKVIPPLGGFDLSFLVAYICIVLLRRFINILIFTL